MELKLYEKVKHNPFVVPKGKKTWEYYPDLGMVDIFCKIPPARLDYNANDVNFILNFCILFCDPYSPHYSEYDIDRKKDGICKVLKIPKMRREDIMSDSPHFTSMLFTYLWTINNMMYETWLTLKIMHRNIQKDMRKNVFDLKYISHMKKLTEEIQTLESQLFKSEYERRLVGQKTAIEKMQGHAERCALHLEQ